MVQSKECLGFEILKPPEKAEKKTDNEIKNDEKMLPKKIYESTNIS